MTILLDTDVLSNALSRVPNPGLMQRLAAVPSAEQCVSTVTVAEMLYGLERSGRHERIREGLEFDILPRLTILPFDLAAAREYAVLRNSLERLGRPLEDADMMIAATALAHGLPLVTGNERHFARVPRLRVYNWLE